MSPATAAPAGFMKVMVNLVSISMIGVGITSRSVDSCRRRASVAFIRLISESVTRVPLPFIGMAVLEKKVTWSPF
ncbi:MAG: hypothetical protein ACD_75C02147G0002 [uncultured bacterium]|nr:MAG: hypothetical protein ACD_75C02147G0002 [uncultured bacterium]